VPVGSPPCPEIEIPSFAVGRLLFVNRQLVRIRLGFAADYYRRVLTQAVGEATRPWATRLGTTAVIAALSFVASWSITGSGGLRLAFALAGVVGFWLLVVAWYLLTIPPRIEATMQQKEEALRLMSERRGIATELRNLTAVARVEARKARDREIQAGSQGGRIVPDEFHQRALDIAGQAVEVLQRNGNRTGHISYVDQIEEINGAVSARRCATADEAIEQLEALAAVFDRQILSNVYW